jgi:DHA2 family multidrug resistance protein
VENLSPLNGSYQSALAAAKQMFMSRGSDAFHAAAQAQLMLYGMVQRQAMLLSFLENFRLLALTFLAVIPLMFLMKRIRTSRKTEMIVE